MHRDRESAWESARYDREQRDQVTSRIRFGSVVFNAASLITVINAPAFLSTAPAAVILISAGFFLVGVVSAGYSLVAHQTSLITVAGYSAARAIALDRAVAIVDKGPTTFEYHHDLGEVMDEAQELYEKAVQPRLTAVWLQNASTGAWLGGASAIAFFKIFESLPPWPWF